MLQSKLLRRRPARSKTARAADKLWGGYSTDARDELDGIVGSLSSSRRERAGAAWELARWHAFRGDAEATLHCLGLIPPLDSSRRLAKGKLLLEVPALLASGKPDEAESIAFGALSRLANDPDVCLMAANTLIEHEASIEADGETDGEAGGSSDERRLALVNRMYARRGLLPIRKIDAGSALSLDNITAASSSIAKEANGPKVSVIMPVYNAAATLGYALRSVQEQTWRNLQIIVVDDASSDETVAVASEAACHDARVSIVRLDRNGGSYVASNKGLEHATGRYVTTHGADDWSHPQKIELQIREPFDGDFAASTSYLVRTSLDLRFKGSWRPNETLLEVNLSSFMLNTALLKELGGWDPVRTSADRELIQRLAAKLGSPSVRLVDKEIPLSFALDQETSLTRTPETHVRSVFFGTINAYQSASRRWHASARQDGDFRIDPDPNAPRKFPAPVTMLSERIAPRPYDVTLIADFGLVDEAFELAYEHLVAALRCGLRVAIFHWPRYDNAPSDVDSRIHPLIDQLKIDRLMPEQSLETGHLVVYAPAILQHRLDQVPRITTERMHVVVDQATEDDGKGAGAQYDPEVVRQNLEALFGSVGEWCPISPLIHDRMAADPRYPEPGGLTWMPWAR